ncbi:hypothetical protein BD769DRAFT_493306 [Suillus cothurnatus]|nr:hypothetical protein BD769DRAFT_493306 [Suillus cothurnatus]
MHWPTEQPKMKIIVFQLEPRSIPRDPDVFAEPDVFEPQRWIDGRGSLRDDIEWIVFGFDQRVCPGQHVTSVHNRPPYSLGLQAHSRSYEALRGHGAHGIPETEFGRMMQNYSEVARETLMMSGWVRKRTKTQSPMNQLSMHPFRTRSMFSFGLRRI